MPSNSTPLPLTRCDFPFSSVRCRVPLTVFAPILSTFTLIRAEIVSDATTAKLSNTRSVFKDEGKTRLSSRYSSGRKRFRRKVGARGVVAKDVEDPAISRQDNAAI